MMWSRASMRMNPRIRRPSRTTPRTTARHCRLGRDETRRSRRLFSNNDKEITTDQCAKHLEELSTANTCAWYQPLAAQLTPSQRQAIAQLLKQKSDSIPEPTRRDLQLVALNIAIPFVGFGIMDNAILIVAGDAIDTSLGVMLGISTMCAAAIGNIVSDVAGVMLGTVIEDATAKYLNLPQPNLSQAQRQLRSVRYSSQLGCAIGIVIGCIIGMFPLLFLDSNKIQVKKRQRHLDSIFRDVVTEAKQLVGAQRTVLFLLVNNDDNEGDDKNDKSKFVPDPNGKYLYAKYGQDEQKTESENDQLFPLGRGIISRAALTGQAWKIDNVWSEPDFLPSLVPFKDVRTMVCVPVLDSHGRAIAVIQAVNKVGPGQGGGQEDKDNHVFTNNDVQILKALASHVSVSLQRMYYDESGEQQAELRLKDTIRTLREHGLEGIHSVEQTLPVRRPLFPPDDDDKTDAAVAGTTG